MIIKCFVGDSYKRFVILYQSNLCSVFFSDGIDGQVHCGFRSLQGPEEGMLQEKDY